jgi:hypothetical protein
VIKYHGTPCSPMKVFYEAFTGRNVLIPYPRPDDLKRAIEVCDKIILDNGAFSIWKKNITVDWNKFYNWVEPLIDRIEFFFIPDVIDGTEEENDLLIDDYINRRIVKGVPIWHVNESIDRLKRLSNMFSYIAIGSAGEYSQLNTNNWNAKMHLAMKAICDKDGYPSVKIHMLRCLDKRIYLNYPFYSGDSTNVAMNHNRKGWKPIMDRIEKYDSPDKYININKETKC